MDQREMSPLNKRNKPNKWQCLELGWTDKTRITLYFTSKLQPSPSHDSPVFPAFAVYFYKTGLCRDFSECGDSWSLGSNLQTSKRKCRVSSVFAIDLNLWSKWQSKKQIPSCPDLLSPVLQLYLVTDTLLKLLVMFEINVCILNELRVLELSVSLYI